MMNTVPMAVNDENADPQRQYVNLHMMRLIHAELCLSDVSSVLPLRAERLSSISFSLLHTIFQAANVECSTDGACSWLRPDCSCCCESTYTSVCSRHHHDGIRCCIAKEYATTSQVHAQQCEHNFSLVCFIRVSLPTTQQQQQMVNTAGAYFNNAQMVPQQIHQQVPNMANQVAGAVIVPPPVGNVDLKFGSNYMPAVKVAQQQVQRAPNGVPHQVVPNQVGGIPSEVLVESADVSRAVDLRVSC